MKIFITREDLYKPELVKCYLPWEEAVHMLNKERLMFNAHFYGYNLIGEDPRKKENYELTKESLLMAKAVATVLLNEKYAFKERKLPVVIHEGNTVFVENAIPGAEFVYEAIKQELEKHGENIENYLILKDPYNTDTWGEIKFLMKQSQSYKPDAIISLAFPNHMLAIEKIWKYYTAWAKLSFKYKHIPEFYLTPLTEVFEYYGKPHMSNLCYTPVMKGREFTELIDHYSAGLLRLILSIPKLQKFIKENLAIYKYDKSKRRS